MIHSGMVRRILAFTLLAPVLLLQGCWDVIDIDNRMLAGVLGIGISDDNQVEVWVRFSQPQSSVASGAGGSNVTSPFILLNQKGKTVIEALDQLRFQLPKALELSNVRTVFVDEKLAMKGLEPYLEFAVRDRTIPLNSQFAIVSDSVNSILSRKNPTGEASGVFTKQFFGAYAGGSPRKNDLDLWKLVSIFKNPYQGNLVPVITRNGETAFKLKGNAYFVEDKMVGMISREDTLIYAMLTETIKNIEIETAQGADVRILKNHNTIKTSWNEQRKPRIEVKAKVIFSLIDTSYLEQVSVKQLEASVNDILEKQAKRILSETQKKKSDIFGFGNRYRGELGENENWRDMYKDAQIEIQVSSQMRNQGLKHIKEKGYKKTSMVKNTLVFNSSDFYADSQSNRRRPRSGTYTGR